MRALRERAGLIRSEAARRAGVSHTAYNQWERGQCVPRADMVPGFCRAYGCSAAELFAIEEPTSDGATQLVAAILRHLDSIVSPIRVENRELKAALNTARRESA